jgi:hypothetical protein
MEESPVESDPKTASDFFVYGPKGNLDIQTEEYLVGRPFAHADWQREKSDADHAVFLAAILSGHNQEARYMHMTINWADSGAFVLELRSTNTNELRDRSEGHCRDIKF